MGHLRRLNYSLSLAVTVTALSIFLVDSAEANLGQILLIAPGLFLEFLLTCIFIHGDGEAFGYTHHGWAANVFIYTSGFYVLLLLYPLLEWFYREVRERWR